MENKHLKTGGINKMKLPTKREIVWALEHQEGTLTEGIKAMEILRMLTSHPDWSSSNVTHCCPLCGYETDATNIHRNCPKAPLDKTVPSGNRHMDVPMYVKEGSQK